MDNPWKVESLQDLTFICCPECAYRSKDESTFQDHALQNHVLSATFFHEDQEEDTNDIVIKVDIPDQDGQDFEPMDEAEPEKVYIKQESQKDILTDVVENLELSNFCESPTKSNKSPTKSNESPAKDYEKVDTKYYSCSRCHDIIKGLINLANHFNRECKNIGDDQYLCPICPSKSFDSPNDLDGHLKEAHLESIVKANISKEKVKVIKILKGNVLEDEIKVSKNKSLQEILEEVSEERQNPDDITEQKCPEPECNENFVSMLNLAEHYYDEHNKMRSKDFKCPICFKGHTKGKLSYLVHVRSDHLNATKKCPECSAVLKLQSYSTHRRRMHMDEKLFPCERCNKDYAYQHQLDRHLKTEVHKMNVPLDGDPLDNEIKAEVPKKMQNVKVMKVTKQPDGTLLCLLCKESFGDIGDVIKHMPNCTNINSAEDREYTYDVLKNLPSNKTTTSTATTITKKKRKTNKSGRPVAADTLPKNERYKCQDCSESYKWKSGLVMHINKIHLPRRNEKKATVFLCNLCPKYYKKSNSDLPIHKYECHVDCAKRILKKCRMCPMRFRYTNAYIKHCEDIHNCKPSEYVDKDTWKCDKCEQTSNSYENLQIHLQSHPKESKRSEALEYSEERPTPKILCSSCGETLYAPNIYIQHYQKHHGGLPPEYNDKEKFVCNKCPSIYISLKALKAHEKNAHSAIKPTKKPKQCGFCDNKYVNLRAHIMKQHKKDTPYKCTLCSFGAINNGHLNSHMKKKHERVNCNVCSQEFCNAFILKRHQAKSHGIIPSDNIQCQHCPMFFKTPGHLTKHMAKVHPYF